MDTKRTKGGALQISHTVNEVSKRYLLLGDIHLDNPKCHEKLLRYDLDEAMDTNAGILLGGDLMCLMQGKNDRRHSKGDLKTENKKSNYLDSVVETTAEFFRPYSDRILMICQGNHECYDVDTEVLTDKGWKLFKDLDRSELIATLNLETNLVEWQAPTAYHQSTHIGKLHHLESRGADFMVTPNHRIIYKQQKAGKYSVKRSDEFKYTRGSSITIPVSGKSGNKDIKSITDDEIKLLGWILTDGHLKVPATGKPKIELYQVASNVGRILKIVNDLGYEYSYNERERRIESIQGVELKKKVNTHSTISVKGRGLERMLKLLSGERVIPDWMFDFSDRQFEIFLSTFIDGDGSRHKSAQSSWMAYGRKEKLEKLQALCVTHGFKASLSVYRNIQYRLNITRHYDYSIAAKGRTFKEVDYDGQVYCLTVPNGTLFVRRNGKVCVSGNSAILNRMETDLTARLIDRLNPKIHYGGYHGFVRFQFNVTETSRRGLTMYYHHGTPGGIISKGTPWVMRYAAMAPDADIVWSGDSHDRWDVMQPRLKLTQSGGKRVEDQLHIRTGTYKEEFDGEGGWATEKIVVPKSLGGVWLTFKNRWGEILPRATMT